MMAKPFMKRAEPLERQNVARLERLFWVIAKRL
jgi:hypothetical protein